MRSLQHHDGGLQQGVGKRQFGVQTMGIQVKCHSCGKAYFIPESWGGKQTPCPQCGTLVDIPRPAAPVTPAHRVQSDRGAQKRLPQQRTEGTRRTEAARSPAAISPAVSGYPRVHTLGELAKRQTRRSLRERLSQGPLLFGIVALSTSLVMVWMIILFWFQGLGPGLIPGAFFFALGLTIVIGGIGINTTGKRLSRGAVKGRIARVALWIAGSFAAGFLAFAGMLLFARLGYPIPLVTQIGAPFLLVSLLVACIAGFVLVYYMLLLFFTATAVLRCAAIGYLAAVLLIGMFVGVYAISSIHSTGGSADSPGASAADAHQPSGDQAGEGPSHPGNGISRPRPAPAPSTSNSHLTRRPSERANASSTDTGNPFQTPFVPPLGSHDPNAMGDRKPSGPERGMPRAGRPELGLPRGPVPSGPFPGRRGPNFDDAVGRLTERYGAERIVTVLVDPVESKDVKRLTDAIRQAAGTDQIGHVATLRNGLLKVTVGPVNDIRAFASRLDVGQITDIDALDRIIRVTGQTQ